MQRRPWRWYLVLDALAIALVASALLPVSSQAAQPPAGASASSSSDVVELYRNQCAECHHKRRIGQSGPPLLPEFLEDKKDEKLREIILEGIPSTKMPAFSNLDAGDVRRLVALMKRPVDVRWSLKDVERSRQVPEDEPTAFSIDRREELTAVVERGTDRVHVLEGDRTLDQFSFPDVHGGIKYTPDGSALFVPSRDGWIGKYNLEEGHFEAKVRTSVYLRNLTVTPDGRYLVASSWLPEGLYVLRTKDLKPVRFMKVPGRISAIYTAPTRNRLVFTLRDEPKVGLVDPKSFRIRYQEVDVPLEDFVIDPFDRYLIGSAKDGTCLRVYDLLKEEVVYTERLPGMPHLFSAAFWYRDGKFFMATPHMRSSDLSVFRLYDWAFVDRVDLGGDGFFVRTHPETPYLWADNGTDELVLVSKQDLSRKTLVPEEGQTVMHTEFSGDGRMAYVSLFEPDGGLVLYDAATLREMKELPMSMPVGKYNFRNKQRRFHAVNRGREVYRERCSGCHNLHRKAFGPSFEWIAENRDRSWIQSQIYNPETTAGHLGYDRSVMPDIELSSREMDALLALFEELRPRRDEERSHVTDHGVRR